VKTTHARKYIWGFSLEGASFWNPRSGQLLQPIASHPHEEVGTTENVTVFLNLIFRRKKIVKNIYT
jgi:hypothetical protein